ncbi:hypothetical protein MMC26_007493 [Xylographa opegraphella]|nr:hypothetical protein [Xylographa opegraphella]
MRSALVWSAFLAITAASPIANPAPQIIDINGINAADSPVPQGPSVGVAVQTPTYNPTVAAASASANAIATPVAAAAASRHVVRDVDAQCGQQPPGSGNVSVPDTPQGFLKDKNYTVSYACIEGLLYILTAIIQLLASINQNGYLGLYTLTSYDTMKCQELCDSVDSCIAFNIYIERDPTVKPAPGCANPPSTVNYKCTLYANHVSSASATNTGEYRQKLQVVIAGSNGYNKNAAPPSYGNFTGPIELAGAIKAPDSSYIGFKFFPGGYVPSLCAAACQATTTFDRETASNGTYAPCNFFNSYVISIDNAPQGTYCAMYTKAWGKAYSTNYGQYRGSQY